MSAREFLERHDTLVVVGMSRHPAKEAHSVPALLQRAGFRTIPVNPYADEILGERAYPSLADVPEQVDAVVVFRPSEDTADVARQAAAVGAKALWLQLGIASPEARRIAEEAGMDYIEDRCTAVEVSRYGICK